MMQNTASKKASEVAVGESLVERDGYLLEVERVTNEGGWVLIDFVRTGMSAINPLRVRATQRLRVLAQEAR